MSNHISDIGRSIGTEAEVCLQSRVSVEKDCLSRKYPLVAIIEPMLTYFFTEPLLINDYFVFVAAEEACPHGQLS